MFAGAANRSPSLHSPSWLSPLPSKSCWNSAPIRPKIASNGGDLINQLRSKGESQFDPSDSLRDLHRCQRSVHGVKINILISIENRKLFYAAQTNSASGHPLIYPQFSDKEKKDFL